MNVRDRLASSLEILKSVQDKKVIRSKDLPRSHRERLVRTGYLQQVLRGWWIVTRPGSEQDPNAWVTTYWTFLSRYLGARFDNQYCLSAETSILLHTGYTVIQQQVVVMVSAKAAAKIRLPHDTELIYYHDPKLPTESEVVNGLLVMPLPMALTRVGPDFYRQHPVDSEIALRMVRDPALLLRHLLEGTRTTVAGRLAGAYRFLGDETTAERIVGTMRATLVDVRRQNPFGGSGPNITSARRLRSPYSARVEALWSAMREDVISVFPEALPVRANLDECVKGVERIFVEDAWNSLAIEGHVVTKEMVGSIIRKEIPDNKGESDINVLALLGYRQAFAATKESIIRIVSGENPGTETQAAHHLWIQELFRPFVSAGNLRAADLVGYRTGQVYISGSRHIPPPHHSLVNALDQLFTMLRTEVHSAVRAILGHFFIGFIHPYMDGNGRVARLLMNAMLVSGGYPWTVVRYKNRRRYWAALEEASVAGDVRPFALFIREEMAIPSLSDSEGT